MKKHHFYIFVVLPLLAVLTVGLLISRDDDQRASAVTPTCPSGGTISLNGQTNGSGTAVLPGMHNLTFTRTTSAEQITQVYFTFDNEMNFVGRGIQQADAFNWSMSWHSGVSPSGSHMIGALVKTPTSSCLVPAINVLIDNSAGRQTLTNAAEPSQFTDYTNVSRDFIVRSFVNRPNMAPVDVSPWALYFKQSVSPGVITSEQNSNILKYFSGSTPGSGSANIKVNYGGVAIPISIPLNVLATPTQEPTPVKQEPPTSGSTTSSPTTTSSSPTASATTQSTTTATSPTTTPQTEPKPLVVDSDPIVKLCIIKAITEPRYLLINSGKDRPTPKEFEMTRQCFATRNFVIPVVFSPIVANKATVKDFEVTKSAQVAAVTTSTIKSETGQKPAIKFSGKAAPFTLVLLYVFSEPLVLSTTSNGDGEWSYSLEDPLEPGKHEAYALVNQGDGVYERSSVFNFAIAKASAASSNPEGYSFNVEANTATPTASNYSTRLYIASVVGLVVLVVGVLVFILVRKQTKPALAITSSVPSDPKPTYTPPQDMIEPIVISPSGTPPTDSSKPDQTQ